MKDFDDDFASDDDFEGTQFSIESSFMTWRGESVPMSQYDQMNSKYPYLASDQEDYLMVLFIAPRTGIVLCSSKIDAGHVGLYSDDWEEEEFIQHPTVLIMKQTEQGL